jgi:outer membrane protein TolC
MAVASNLDDYFSIAAEKDPALKAAYKHVEIAMQKAAQTAALPDPVLSFGYFISPVETRLGPQQFKLSLTQMFPWFGTLKASEKAAALAAESAYDDFLNKKNNLYLTLASLYYPLLEQEAWVRVETDNLDKLTALMTLAKTNYETGKSSMVDLLRIRRMIDEAETELKILKSKKAPLLAAFNARLDRDPDVPVELPDEPERSAMLTDLDLRPDFNEHPSMLALDKAIASKAFAVKAAKRKGLPSFGLGLDYVAVGDRTDMVVTGSGRDVLMPMASLSIPLAVKKNRARIREAQLAQEQLIDSRSALDRELNVRYKEALFDLEQQKDRIELYEKQIKTSNEMLAILRVSYAQDGADLEELLRIWRERLSYEKKSATALSAYYRALAQLRTITVSASDLGEYYENDH